MMRLPLQHWWTVGLLLVSVVALITVTGGLVRLYWWVAALLLWLIAGYVFDKNILYRWAGTFHELVTQNVNQATPWFRKVLQNGQDEPEVQARVGHMALREKDYAEALHHLEAALKRMPRGIQPRLDLALTHSSLGQHEEAERQVKHVLELAPQSQAARLILAQVRKAAGDIGGAQAACQAVIEQDETSASGHRILGETLYHQGDLSEAQRHLQRAVTLDPNHPDSHYWLGTVYLEQNEWLRARQQLIEALNRLVQPAYASEVDRSLVLQKLAQARLRPES